MGCGQSVTAPYLREECKNRLDRFCQIQYIVFDVHTNAYL